MSLPRALYISPVATGEINGMMQRQHQTLETLCRVYDGRVDVLSLAASPAAMKKSLLGAGLRADALIGVYALLARLNTSLWYGGGVILCNRLRLARRFRFPLRTPLPRTWIERYDRIVCYYPWAYLLLRLERAGTKVIVDLGDVMANRHERIGTRRWISLHTDDERAIVNSKSRCVAISQEDAEEFRRLYGVQLPVLPFAPPTHSELAALASTARPARVGYMGAPSYQNEEVLRQLADPVFLECISEAGIELVVAGGICDTAQSSTIEALKRGGARILGRVDSVSNYYAQISATINPVGPSTGIKIKSLETLMAGRALVTTRWGADTSLCDWFGAQIEYVEWPINAHKLAEATVKAVHSATASNRVQAEAYAAQSAQVLQEMLSL